MNWKVKTMLFYGIGGLVIGLIAGMISVSNAVQNDKELDLSKEDKAKLGMAALELLKKAVIK